jgi:hypothetical protein
MMVPLTGAADAPVGAARPRTAAVRPATMIVRICVISFDNRKRFNRQPPNGLLAASNVGASVYTQPFDSVLR